MYAAFLLVDGVNEVYDEDTDDEGFEIISWPVHHDPEAALQNMGGAKPS